MEDSQDLCILCEFRIDQVKVAKRRGARAEQEKLSTTDLLLLPHLRVIYLIDQLFGKDVKELEALNELLQVLGDPDKWFGICGQCSALVDQGIELWKELKRLESEHQNLLKSLMKRLRTGGGGGAVDFNGREGHERKKEVRRALRNELKGSLILDYNAPKLEPEEPEPEPDELEPVESEPEEPESPVMNNFSEDDDDDTWCPTSQRPKSSPKKKRKTAPKKKAVSTESDERKDDDDTCPTSQLAPSPPKKKRTTGPLKKKKVSSDSEEWKDEENGGMSSSSSESDFDADYKPSYRDPCAAAEKKERKARYLTIRAIEQEFNDKCGDYLDTTLVVYPPKTPEDYAKIPSVSKLRDWEEGSDLKGSFPCPSCEKKFRTWYFCLAHIHTVHLGIRKPWRCSHCTRKFVGVKQFQLHLKSHKEGRLMNCKICSSFSSKRKTVMDHHIIQHFGKVANPQCPECSVELANFKYFLKHMAEQHGYRWKNPICHLCELCSESLKSLKYLKFHKVTKHGEEDVEGIFPVCQFCQKPFITEERLECHLGKEHLDSLPALQKFFCDQCGNEYPSERLLTQHLTTHLVQPDVCRVCGLIFKNPTCVETHVAGQHSETRSMTEKELTEYKRRHEEDPQWSCVYCHERFAFRVQMYHHQRTGHPEITDKYKCVECGKGFSRGSSLKRHEETAHLRTKVNCQWCGKLYAKANLYQHQTFHCAELKRRRRQEQGTTDQLGIPFLSDQNNMP